MKGIYVTLSWRSCISQKQLKAGFSTILINPVSLASHSTTSETNQVQKNAKRKGKAKTNPFTKSNIHSQTNQLKSQ